MMFINPAHSFIFEHFRIFALFPHSVAHCFAPEVWHVSSLLCLLTRSGGGVVGSAVSGAERAGFAPILNDPAIKCVLA